MIYFLTFGSYAPDCLYIFFAIEIKQNRQTKKNHAKNKINKNKAKR